MEIPAWLFFSFWALTSITFLHMGFNALHQTHLPTSVSPQFMFLLKHLLAISSCCSSNYALRYRPSEHEHLHSRYLLTLYVILCTVLTTTADGIILRRIFTASILSLLNLMIPMLPSFIFLYEMISKIPRHTLLVIQCALLLYKVGFAIVPIIYSLIKIGLLSLLVLVVKLVSTVFSLEFLCYLPIFSIGLLCHFSLLILQFSWIAFVLLLDIILTCGTGDSYSTPETKARVAILMVSEMSLFFVSVENTEFYAVLVLFISHSISALLAAQDQRLKESVHAVVNVKVKESRVWRLIEFGGGIVGAIVFHNLFKATSFNEVEAFLYLAVVWLSNLTLLAFPIDFGIFDFLVCSVMVGCFMMRSEVAVAAAYAAATLLLFGLRLKLESLTLEYEEGDQIQVQ